jgi:hypothetical protein
LQLGDFEAFAAANVAAGYEVISAHHVGLGFGEAGPVSFIGVAGQLRPFAPHNPIDLVLAGLAAVRADKGMSFGFIGFGKKIAFFHHWVNSQLSSRSKVFHTRECHDETKS